jgi:hypothetical protein
MTKVLIKQEDALRYIKGRVAGQRTVDPRQINLTDPFDALELTVFGDVEGFIHILHYRHVTHLDGRISVRQGVKIGQTDSKTEPCDAAWERAEGGLRLLCDIVTGSVEATTDTNTGALVYDCNALNDDPMLIVNFESASRREVLFGENV